MARHPRDYSGERRTEKFTLQFTPSEKRNLDLLAQGGRMPKSEVVRARIRLAVKTQRREDEVGKGSHQWRRAEPWKVDAVREVNRIGVNINQLTHRINRIGEVPEAAILRAIAADLKAALSRLV